MPLQKQAVSINFAQGLDQKTDPKQLALGKFVSLENTIFTTTGRLTKRNGFQNLPALPDNSSTYVATFNGNLTAIGNSFQALSDPSDSWINKGTFTPVQLDTMSLIKNSSNQTYADVAIAPNGLLCTAFAENQPVGSTTTKSIFKYSIADSTTGQNIIAPTELISSFGTVSFTPKVFTLGNNFVLVFGATNGVTYKLQYMAVNSFMPTSVSSVTDVTSTYVPASTGAFDGTVANDSLYLGWNAGGGTGINAAYLSRTLVLSAEATISSVTATVMNVTADTTGTTPVLWFSSYVTGSQSGSVVATNQALSTLFSSKQFINSASATISNLAGTAQGGLLNLNFEVNNTYSFGSGSFTHRIRKIQCTNTGSLTANSIVLRSVGLASKAFLISSQSYMLTSYQSELQPSYFLLNSSGGVVAKLAYSNGQGYLTTGLPNVTVASNTAYIPYVVKNFIEPVNKDIVSSGTSTLGVYSQSGINLAKFTFGTEGLTSTEIGQNLNTNGGFLSSYDGILPTENNFFLYPDSLFIQAAGVNGAMTNQQYYYQVLYAWQDNQGNFFRSAPSLPITFTTSTGTGAITLHIPCIKITNKTSSPIKVEVYRWSTAQQTFYQATSVAVPLLNDTTIDAISFNDTQSDAQIIGNSILYTTGGVIENISPPACKTITTFDSRLWLIDAENQNVLWFSKPVIQGTPVEMSDLFTKYIAPNAAAQGNTGPMRALAPMDDKLIIFKKNAIYFINGVGPDITGGNNQYSEPIFITGTVGCEKENSIVLIPQGLMFQSDKGIWLLGRDLNTKYIGSDVSNFNDIDVKSALVVPGTNQVRFTLESGDTLMYDYYEDQWCTFTSPAGTGISSTLYQNLHTYIDSNGRVFQEKPGSYLDGSNPVLLSFKTGWTNLADVQGYVRAYRAYLLGEYFSPHRLTLGVAYDYDETVVQLATIVPNNYSGSWGSGTSWGSITAWGGPSSREQWQVNFERQQCQSFQLTFNEYFDSSIGEAPGAGLTLSGIKLVAGVKKGWPGNVPPSNRTS